MKIFHEKTKKTVMCKPYLESWRNAHCLLDWFTGPSACSKCFFHVRTYSHPHTIPLKLFQFFLEKFHIFVEATKSISLRGDWNSQEATLRINNHVIICNFKESKALDLRYVSVNKTILKLLRNHFTFEIIPSVLWGWIKMSVTVWMVHF